MLHNGHNLDMCVSHLQNIVRDKRCQFPVIVELTSVIGLHKGTQMHLIDAERFILSLDFLPVLKPFIICPFVILNISYNRCRCRTYLCAESIRICLELDDIAL